MTENKVLIHKKTFNIAWGDMDALGHVNNARYFDYFQEARIEWLAEHNFDLCQPTGPVLVQASCTFFKPIVYPAMVTLLSSVHSLGRSSFIIDQDLLQDAQLMARGSTKIVWVDYKKGKSVNLPEDLRQLLMKA